MIRSRTRRSFTLGAVIGTAFWGMLSAGCASSTDRQDAALRRVHDDDLSWVEGRPDLLFPRDRYFVGLGTCGPEVGDSERMDCAINRALAQAVAMVRQNVTVEIRRRTELDHRADAQGFQTFIRSSYQHDGLGQAELMVDDAAPRRRVCTSDGRCHALVALDRGVLAGRSLKRIEQMQAEVGKILDRAEQSDTITAIEQLSIASRLLARIEGEAELLAAVSGPYAVPPSAWSRFSTVRSKRLESLAVCLSSSLPDSPAQLVFARVHQDLATRGFARVAIASEPDCPPESISVTFEGATHERPAEFRLWVFEVRGTVVLRAGVRTLGKGLPVVGRGVARRREQARSEAQEDLALNVQQSLARLLDPTGANVP